MSDTIQEKLDQVPLGGTLKLEPPRSEIQGPLVLRHPITIVGQGCSIWAEKGPVLTAESSGVLLQDLNVEVTGSQPDQGGPESCALVVAPKVGIAMKNVVVRGNVHGLAGEVGQWRYPRSVRLGSIKADQQHSFIVRLVVPVVCQLASEISGLEVKPAKLAPGPVEVTLAVDPLKAGTRLRGFLKLRTPLVTRQIQVTCHVQADAQAAVGTGQCVDQPADWGAAPTPPPPTAPEPTSLPMSPPAPPLVINPAPQITLDPTSAVPDFSLDEPVAPTPPEVEDQPPSSTPISTPASPRPGAKRGRHRRPDTALPGVFGQPAAANTEAAAAETQRGSEPLSPLWGGASAEPAEPPTPVADEPTADSTPITSSPPIHSPPARTKRPPVSSLFAPTPVVAPESTEATPAEAAEEPVPTSEPSPPAQTPGKRTARGRKLPGIFGDSSEPRP